jgi:ribosomal protein S18 acetylase RimI-like enzyme
VDLIVVDKKLRRRHLGKALFDAALSELKTLGVANILLNVKMGNIPAMLFWSAQGFKKISDTEYKRSDGAKEKTMYMVKKI